MRKKFTFLIASLALLLGSSMLWAQQGVLLPEYQNEQVTPRRGDAPGIDFINNSSNPTGATNVNNEFGAGESSFIENNAITFPTPNSLTNNPILRIGSNDSKNIMINSYNAQGYASGWLEINVWQTICTSSSTTGWATANIPGEGQVNLMQGYGSTSTTELITASLSSQGGSLGTLSTILGWTTRDSTNKVALYMTQHGQTANASNSGNGMYTFNKVPHFTPYASTASPFTTAAPANLAIRKDDGVQLVQYDGQKLVSSTANPGNAPGNGILTPYQRPTSVSLNGNNTFEQISFSQLNWWFQKHEIEPFQPENLYYRTTDQSSKHPWDCCHYRGNSYDSSRDPINSENIKILVTNVPDWTDRTPEVGNTLLDAAVVLLNGANVCVENDVMDNTGSITGKKSTDASNAQTNALIILPKKDRVTFRTGGDFKANMHHEPDSSTATKVIYSAAEFPDPDQHIYLYKGSGTQGIGTPLHNFGNAKYTTITTTAPYMSTTSSVFGVNGDYLFTGNMAEIHTDSTTFNNGNKGVIEVGEMTAGKSHFHVYAHGMLKNYEGCNILSNFAMNFGDKWGSDYYGGTPDFKINTDDALYIVNFGNIGTTSYCDADLLFHTTSVDSLNHAFTTNGAGALQIQALSHVRFMADGTWNPVATASHKGNNIFVLSDGGNISTQKLAISNDNKGGVGHGLITFWAETDTKTDACAANTPANRFSKSGNIYFNDAVTLTRAAITETTQTNIIAANNIRTASLASTNTNDEDTTNIVSRMGDIYLGYSAGSKVYNSSDNQQVNGTTANTNVFTYNGTGTSGTLNILAGFDDAVDNKNRNEGGNIYFTQINATMTAGNDHATNIMIPFSNEYTCGTNNDSVLHRRAGESMQHYEHAGIIGGVGRGGAEGDFSTYAKQLENAGDSVSLNMAAKSLDYVANNGDLTVDAGTRGNIIMNTGTSLDFQSDAGNGLFRTRYGDIDMRGETDVKQLHKSLLFLASSDDAKKWLTAGGVCGCDEARNNVYLQDFQYDNTTGGLHNGSVFVGADNNIKLNYGGLTNRATQADPFLSKDFDKRYNWGTPYKGDYHCDLNPAINQARDFTLNFTGVNGGFAAVAADRIDVYKKLIYTGGTGVGMSAVPEHVTLQGEAVAGYGLYMKTTAAKNSWTFNSLTGGIPKCPFSCVADDCGDAALHNIVRMTFHDDARIFANNQKVLLASPVIESYGHMELDVVNGTGSKTSITIKADSLIFHDSLILNETTTNKIKFETWSSGLKTPIMKFGYKRTSPPVQEIIYDENGNPFQCNDCVTHTKGDPKSKIDTMVVVFKNDASLVRSESTIVDHTVITFLTDSFDHVKGGLIRNAKMYTDIFKIRNQVEFWRDAPRERDGHFELISEEQMYSKDYAGAFARHLHLEPIGACGRPYSDLWLCDPALDVITTSTFGGYGKIHADVHVEIEAKLAPGYASLGLQGNCYEQKAGTLSMENLRLDKGAQLHYTIGDVKGFNNEYTDCIEADEITLYGDVFIHVEKRNCQDYVPGCYPLILYNSVALGSSNLNNLKLATKQIDGQKLSLDMSVDGVVYLCVGDGATPSILREVYIPETPGVTIISPEYGKNYINSYGNFTFTAKFDVEPPLKVTTGRIIDGMVEELFGTKNANGEYVYVIRRVQENLVLKFGPEATPNSIIEGAAVWSHGNTIYIKVEKEDIASIYSVAGQLVRRIELPEGSTSIPMERGIYIITLKDGSVHKVILK